MKTEKQKTEKTEVKKAPKIQEESQEMLVRIFGQDIPASKNLYVGLTKIRGISWAVSNALCAQLEIDKRMKIGEITKETIGKIEKKLSALQLPVFLQNRRRDPETGIDRHLLSNALDIQKEFDIKKLKKMKSYRGIRHAQGLPVRGQRTRSHFRKKGGSTGVTRKKDDTKA